MYNLCRYLINNFNVHLHLYEVGQFNYKEFYLKNKSNKIILIIIIIVKEQPNNNEIKYTTKKQKE